MKYAPRKVYIKESGGYVELSYTDFCRRRQADKGYMDKLFIPVQGCLLEVVREQYADFYRDRERWRYLQKLDARNISESKIPVSLEKFLTENPQIHTVILHLDNDRAGRWSTAALKEIMRDRWEIIDDPPPHGKDFNDLLRLYLGIPIAKTSRESVR